jgi:thiol-disulfide isomerase/thioredoxin
VFFWGHDCPNCEVAKKMLLQDAELVKPLGIRWFHVNVYEDMELGTRFGLHGIPAFFFFKESRKLGKISPFPGMDPFMSALRELRLKHPITQT